MTQIELNPAELAVLAKPLAGQGGYQSLLKSLQQRAAAAGKLTLSASELEQIPRYAFDYGQGGWEDRLRSVFERNLGAKLGR